MWAFTKFHSVNKKKSRYLSNSDLWNWGAQHTDTVREKNSPMLHMHDTTLAVSALFARIMGSHGTTEQGSPRGEQAQAWSGHLRIPDSLHDNQPIFQNVFCMWTRVFSIYTGSICGIVGAAGSLGHRCDVPPGQKEARRAEIKRCVDLAEGRVEGGKQKHYI